MSFSFLVVKKKGTTGLKLSNLMNLGRKKSSSLDSPERSLETSSKWQHEFLCRICLRAGSQSAGQDEHQASPSSNVPVPGVPASKSMEIVVPVALRVTQEEGWVIPEMHTQGICAAQGV